MAGASGFNEVFFTDSVVPDAMRVGEVGEGWRVANATLMNERVSIGSEVAPQGSGPIARAVAAWRDARDPSPAQRDRLMQLWVDAEVLRLGSLRAQAKREKGVPGPEGSILKLMQGRVLVDVADLGRRPHGTGGHGVGRAVHHHNPKNWSTNARWGATTRCCRSAARRLPPLRAAPRRSR